MARAWQSRAPYCARRRKTIWAVLALAVPVLMRASAQGQTLPNESSRTLTKVTQIRALSESEAKLKYHIRLEGVITYISPEYRVTFFQDDSAGIYLFLQEFDPQLEAGSLVSVEGNTTPGEFAPSIENAKIRILGHRALPTGVLKSMDVLLTGA